MTLLRRSRRSPRRFAALGVALLMLPLAACNGGDGKRDQTGDAGQAASDPCSLLPEPDAESAFGAGVDLVTEATTVTSTCTYRTEPASGALKIVTVTPSYHLDQDFQKFSTAQAGVFGGQGTPSPVVEKVRDLGDRAYGFDAGIAYILNVLRGDTAITISVTGDDDGSAVARRVAQRVLANL